MIDGNRLGTVGFEKLGTPYKQMDCQAFVEWCLSRCGLKKDLPGSNAWYREVMKNGAVLSPEECVKQLGKVPAGAFLFILNQDGKEPAKYRKDGLGNASHIGIATGRGEGAIHSSSSRGCVAESRFRGKTINGGWNRVGLWNRVSYDYGANSGETRAETPASRPTLHKGSRGDAVKELQAVLMARGYDLGRWGADGIFGNQTLKAVKSFQKDCGIQADGIAGPVTYSCLFS